MSYVHLAGSGSAPSGELNSSLQTSVYPGGGAGTVCGGWAYAKKAARGTRIRSRSVPHGMRGNLFMATSMDANGLGEGAKKTWSGGVGRQWWRLAALRGVLRGPKAARYTLARRARRVPMRCERAETRHRWKDRGLAGPAEKRVLLEAEKSCRWLKFKLARITFSPWPTGAWRIAAGRPNETKVCGRASM